MEFVWQKFFRQISFSADQEVLDNIHNIEVIIFVWNEVGDYYHTKNWLSSRIHLTITNPRNMLHMDVYCRKKISVIFLSLMITTVIIFSILRNFTILPRGIICIYDEKLKMQTSYTSHMICFCTVCITTILNHNDLRNRHCLNLTSLIR